MSDSVQLTMLVAIEMAFALCVQAFVLPSTDSLKADIAAVMRTLDLPAPGK